jgi:hypothetical protein
LRIANRGVATKRVRIICYAALVDTSLVSPSNAKRTVTAGRLIGGRFALEAVKNSQHFQTQVITRSEAERREREERREVSKGEKERGTQVEHCLS